QHHVPRLARNECIACELTIRLSWRPPDQLQRGVLRHGDTDLPQRRVHPSTQHGLRLFEPIADASVQRLVPTGGRSRATGGHPLVIHVRSLTYSSCQLSDIAAGRPGARRTPSQPGGPMTTATGPDFIALQTPEIESVASFYETHLGLQRSAQAPPGAVVFETTPIPFAIRTPTPGTNLDEGERHGEGVALWMHCADSQRLHEEL